MSAVLLFPLRLEPSTGHREAGPLQLYVEGAGAVGNRRSVSLWDQPDGLPAHRIYSELTPTGSLPSTNISWAPAGCGGGRCRPGPQGPPWLGGWTDKYGLSAGHTPCSRLTDRRDPKTSAGEPTGLLTQEANMVLGRHPRGSNAWPGSWRKTGQ